MKDKKKLQKRFVKGLLILNAVFVAIIILVVLFFFNDSLKKDVSQNEMNIREPSVSGQFYPNEKSVLNESVNSMLTKAQHNLIIGEIKALIVPHAGYVYSGNVAAEAFVQLNNNYDTVIIIATNHNPKANFNGIALTNSTHFRTPLGLVNTSKLSEELSKDPLFVYNEEAHKDHMIEVELPFLQQKLKGFEIVPLVTGALSEEQISHASTILGKYIDDKTLIVVSTDLPHYHDSVSAETLDKKCISALDSLDYQKIKGCEACGSYALDTLAKIAIEKGWKSSFLDYAHSGYITNDNSRVVGYTSFMFTKEDESLSDSERKFLLDIARKKLDSIYSGEKFLIDESNVPSSLKEEKGCFTTLNKNDQLRGCIGYIYPEKEIYRCVIDNVENAAFHDSRFYPVKEEELDVIKIEISILSVPEESDLAGITEDKEGVVLKKGIRQATYLPQVWEQFSSKNDFLSSLCEKAPLTKTCWKEDDIKFYTYTAEVFSE